MLFPDFKTELHHPHLKKEILDIYFQISAILCLKNTLFQVGSVLLSKHLKSIPSHASNSVLSSNFILSQNRLMQNAW
jgi:hypothetical protein